LDKVFTNRVIDKYNESYNNQFMKIVIIGGVAAGAKAAAKIKRLLPDASVEIYTDDTHVSYSSCGLPYYIEGNFTDYRMLLVRSVEEFKSSGIDVYLQNRVDKILPAQHQILVSTDKEARLVKYDKLIIATGARPRIPDIKGVNDFGNIFTLRKIEDGIKIRDYMLKSKHVAIIGSGLIGLELLEAFGGFLMKQANVNQGFSVYYENKVYTFHVDHLEGGLIRLGKCFDREVRTTDDYKFLTIDIYEAYNRACQYVK
jgi:NAD(P)H-nitrite reductase large subunit